MGGILEVDGRRFEITSVGAPNTFDDQRQPTQVYVDTRETTVPDMNASTELVKGVSIGDILRQRDAVLGKVKAVADAVKEVDEATELLRDPRSRLPVLGGGSWMFRKTAYGGRGNTIFYEDNPVECVRRTLDRHIWSFLMYESGMLSFMDHRARDEWYRELDGKPTYQTTGQPGPLSGPPPVTLDNIIATFRQLHEDRKDMFDRGVVEVFRGLSWDYKTNSPCKFGKRVVLTRVIETRYLGLHWPTPWGTEVDRLRDLERCMTMSDGHPEPDHRTSQVARWSDFVRNASIATRDFQTELFAFRWFKNGNVHITFRRPDLVDKMNAIIGKHHPNVLPPART